LPQSAFKPGSDEFGPPWPRVLIGCGKAGLVASLALARWNGRASFRVQTQDPRLSPRHFDLVVPPAHDRLNGENVFSILGSPNRVTREKLTKAARRFSARYGHLPHPRVAVLIGGSARGHPLTAAHMNRLAETLLELTKSGAGLMLTVSRRTGPDNTARLRARLAGPQSDLWDGTGDNPYYGILALADFILVSEDSTNMATEAAVTAKPIYILPLAGVRAKQARLHAELAERGIARPFTGRLVPFSYAPLEETARAAAEIVRRAGLGAN
jgi:mitochondrial fission protein ELM1